MKYADSGLPENSPLVRKAFDYSYAAMTTFKDLLIQAQQESIELRIFASEYDCDQSFKDGGMVQEEYAAAIQNLREKKKALLRDIPKKIDAAQKSAFQNSIVTPVREIIDHVQIPVSEERLAAVMLFGLPAAIQGASYTHFENIQKTFGRSVIEPLVEMDHFLQTPDKYAERAATLSPEAKAAFTAYIAGEFLAATEIQNQNFVLEPTAIVHKEFAESDKKILGFLQVVWGTDSKAEEFFVQSFNAQRKAAGSQMRIVTDADGRPVLKQNNAVPVRERPMAREGIAAQVNFAFQPGASVKVVPDSKDNKGGPTGGNGPLPS